MAPYNTPTTTSTYPQNNTDHADFSYNRRMEKTVVVNAKDAPKSTARSSRTWLLYSSLIFIAFFVIGLVAITLLNSGWMNHVMYPVGASFSMFQLIWPEQPLAALEFLLTQSFVVLAHKDPRSALNLWTLEYDAITLLVYFLVAILLSLNFSIRSRRNLPVLLGSSLSIISVTYMTAIEHCSGATWVGFVALYGMGFDGFDLFPVYQWILFLLGAGLVILGLRKRAIYTS